MHIMNHETPFALLFFLTAILIQLSDMLHVTTRSIGCVKKNYATGILV